ncbi:MAG: hypothetical protein ACFN3I_12505 [Arachnia propionica]
MLGAERIRGIVAGLEMKYARTRWRSDNLRGDHDRSVHAPPRIPVLEPGRLEPAPGIERGPLQLIDARTGIVPFADRDELTALIDWACAPQARNGRDLALAVVTGAGGSGRTRLAVELCSALGRNGWGTGFGGYRNSPGLSHFHAVVFGGVVACGESNARSVLNTAREVEHIG